MRLSKIEQSEILELVELIPLCGKNIILINGEVLGVVDQAGLENQ